MDAPQFRYFTREQFDAWLRRRGQENMRCTDPAVLDRAAAIAVAALRRKQQQEDQA